jgi:hypothetical protein
MATQSDHSDAQALGNQVDTLRVLVACEYSGKVREAFRKLGHDAWSCDLLPADDNSPYHIQGDVLQILEQGWDLMIAHPPCTYLTNSGVRWLYSEAERWKDLIEGAVFFRQLLHAPIPKIAVENPIMHKYAKQIVGVPQTQIIQPWQFGHGETKATCLWLKGLSPLKPTKIVDGRHGKVWRMAPSEDRWKLRSETYQGIADAMSQQWGNDLAATDSEASNDSLKSAPSRPANKEQPHD